MKRVLLSLITASVLIEGSLITAAAAPWQSINERQAILEGRINQGIRSGALTRVEAITLRGEFQALARLEANYRKSGGYLTGGERRDLDQRFEVLRLRIRTERRDTQERWVPINERQERIEERIDHGVRRGSLTRTEAIELRGDFNTLVRLEAEYRRSRGVFTPEERLDLDKRLDVLSRRVNAERRDRQSRG